jgi:hypothetical protein
MHNSHDLKAIGIYESFARTIDLLGRVKKAGKSQMVRSFYWPSRLLIIRGIMIYFLLESIFDTK